MCEVGSVAEPSPLTKANLVILVWVKKALYKPKPSPKLVLAFAPVLLAVADLKDDDPREPKPMKLPSLDFGPAVLIIICHPEFALSLHGKVCSPIFFIATSHLVQYRIDMTSVFVLPLLACTEVTVPTTNNVATIRTLCKLRRGIVVLCIVDHTICSFVWKTLTSRSPVDVISVSLMRMVDALTSPTRW